MLSAALAGGCRELGLELSAEQSGQMLAYLKLLVKWNKAYNLTAIRAPEEMIGKHLLDSLSILPYVRGPRVLDVGSGAGLPGIPLAIAAPQHEYVLLDANSKKTRFLLQVKGELQLSRVSVIHSRLEEYHPAEPFDSITSRAFASLAQMVGASARLLAADGCLLAMKGAYPQAELADLPAGFVTSKTVALQVPQLDAARHLVCITRA